jgi:hypothetical protein
LNEPNEDVGVQDLVAHYEQLRRDARDVPARCREGLGLALFLRRGMAAWMQAWSPCTSCVTPQAQTLPATTAPGPVDVRVQVATLPAEIIVLTHISLAMLRSMQCVPVPIGRWVPSVVVSDPDRLSALQP